MKTNRTTILLFVLLLLASVIYRFIPNIPFGITPQVAMALVGGAVIRDKKWAFVMPVLSLFISDLIFYFLHRAGLTDTLGFYQGQWVIYLAFMLITCLGFLLKKINWLNITLFSVAGSIIFFLISNYITWEVGQGLGRPHTFNGLMLCYQDGLAFYRQFGLIKGFAANFVLGDILWSYALFGAYFLLARFFSVSKPQLAS